MTIYGNTFEHGTAGVTLTQANSGDGGSNVAVMAAPGITAGHTLTFTDEWAAHGTKAVKVVSTSTGGTSLRWALSGSDRWDFQVYYRIGARPTTLSYPIIVPNGSSAGSKILMHNDGSFSAQNAAGTSIAGSGSGSVVAPLNATFRLDTWVVRGTTTSNGTIGYAVHLTDPEGTTPDFTWESTAVNAGTVQLTSFYVGKATSAGSPGTVLFDTVRWSDSGPLEPFAPAGPADVRRVTPLGKVALIGDSQFENGGEANIRTQLARVGWGNAADIYFHGVGGKTLTTADSTGTTTIQNVAAARTALGGEPDLWVINLGGNSSGTSETIFRNGVRGILDAIGDTHPVLWFGIQGNPNTTARATATEWLRQEVAARPLARYVDTQAWIHDGRDETGLWNADAIHMLTAGYTLRNAWVADRANRYRTEIIGSSTTTTTTAVGASASARTGASVASVGVSVVGAGRKVARAGSTASVASAPTAGGRKVARGSSAAAVTATALGAGRKAGRGASLALTTAAPVASGRKRTAAGALAAVAVTALGAGVHPTSGAGGSAAQVGVAAVGAGVARRVGARIVTVQVATVGAGVKPAADVRTGGFTTAIAVAAVATGRRVARGGSVAAVAVTVVSVAALPPDPGDLILASGGATSNPFRIGTPRRL